MPENEMKTYAPRWNRGMTFAALLVTFTASFVIAQDTVSPGGDQAIRFTPAE
jgi:hypothetical protein